VLRSFGSFHIIIFFSGSFVFTLLFRLNFNSRVGCLDALKQALKLTKPAKSEIINTDQGSQFTSAFWIITLLNLGIKISMDGKVTIKFHLALSVGRASLRGAQRRSNPALNKTLAGKFFFL
jgi:hypothetical protein